MFCALGIDRQMQLVTKTECPGMAANGEPRTLTDCDQIYDQKFSGLGHSPKLPLKGQCGTVAHASGAKPSLLLMRRAVDRQ